MFARSFVSCLTLTAACFLPALVQAQGNTQENTPPTITHKWGAHIDLEGKMGTDRDLGEADLFIPLSQDENTLFFTTLRGRIDNQDSEEGNFGLGLRQMLSNGWNIGGYTYFDRRNTDYNNNFHQVTIGAEALSESIDLRANIYVPVGDKTKAATGAGTATFSGAGISVRPGEEKALRGFDAEIGWRAPVFDLQSNQQLRLYAGGYHFNTSGVEDVTGPRARAELVFTEVKQLWSGSRLSLNAEFQHDDPRGSQGFISARLRIPLQKESRNLAKLSYMEQRMVDPIVRDIDIVSQAGDFGAPETVTQTADGKTITVLDSATVTGATLATAIDGAGDNAAVILNGDYSALNDHIAIRQGQSIYGGANVAVRLANGSTEVVATPSSTITGTGGNGGSGTRRFFTMNDNSHLEGINMQQTNSASVTAIYINEVDNVRVINNTINATATASDSVGITITSGTIAARPTGTVIRGNSITASGSVTSNTRGISMVHSDNTTITNNSFTITSNAPAAQQQLLFFGGNSNNLSGSGNSGNISTCQHASGTITGSIGFKMSTNNDCP